MRQRVRDIMQQGDKRFGDHDLILPLWQTLAENFHVMRADFTRVLASLRRGARISWRRFEARTRLSPEGVRAPVQVRGVLAKEEPRGRVNRVGSGIGRVKNATADTSTGLGPAVTAGERGP